MCVCERAKDTTLPCWFLLACTEDVQHRIHLAGGRADLNLHYSLVSA